MSEQSLAGFRLIDVLDLLVSIVFVLVAMPTLIADTIVVLVILGYLIGTPHPLGRNSRRPARHLGAPRLHHSQPRLLTLQHLLERASDPACQVKGKIE